MFGCECVALVQAIIDMECPPDEAERERSTSINLALNQLESQTERLFGGMALNQQKQASDPAAPPIGNVDMHLAYCSQQFALIEGRIATLIALLEHRL